MEFNLPKLSSIDSDFDSFDRVGDPIVSWLIWFILGLDMRGEVDIQTEKLLMKSIIFNSFYHRIRYRKFGIKNLESFNI